ncbi:MAG TPA: NnrS family protein [Burkholderiaceae bacterium]|nr:NnrS family protein [Burkholderiaceae bacterium]
MPDEPLERLRRFQRDAFPRYRAQFRQLVDDGRPLTLFIGCNDSRIVPYLLTGAGPGELLLVRNVGAFVPPYDQTLDGPQDACGVVPPRGLTQLGTARRWVVFHGTATTTLGSMLFAMATRVIRGHGGITLVADNVVWALFWLLQAAALLRIASPIGKGAGSMFETAAAIVWTVTWAAWVTTHLPLLLKPRADGRPG